MKNLKGSIILFIAAFFWGTTFAAQSSGAENLDTFTFNACRSFVGSFFLCIVILIRHFLSAQKADGRSDKPPVRRKAPLKEGLVCGLILFLGMTFQQGGIGLYPNGVASSGRSGFLTATYVVMVAVYLQIKGRRVRKTVLLSVCITLLGMYLLCISDSFSNIYFGDVLILLCAVSYAFHILVVDHFSGCDSIVLSCLQLVLSAALSLAFALLFEHPSLSDILSAVGPILYAGVLSSGVAFTLQFVGQKYAEPTVASIVMSLESVFAVLAGCLILGEVLSVREAAGCVLVFFAVILAQLPEKKFSNFEKNIHFF